MLSRSLMAWAAAKLAYQAAGVSPSSQVIWQVYTVLKALHSSCNVLPHSNALGAQICRPTWFRGGFQWCSTWQHIQ